ncbi:hypothetical protein COCC4DRAFT_149257 [Bipolaris maydis ATCC 48331]|uniref:Acyl-CoA dehydrogenase n=2 Tax=Cochliobolus heterostrophus TaxID=5016 RepID=M2U9M2_COCH5|nr:uncharacterized protein COCC4DRAFT_149257 [Bipolaris maydis ATCC 48331]EMD95279.1 hypothetical protein COCHEDRAFT_1222437 [Bipolaris maydis C5]KAH7556189.1 hypothetical protein BM1_06715 [Bipolaris maydis]ENI00828.1 hypothetical protein COCC4DRAFT_149257 [Bipolaris maydis ATCC 48331]KAJ5021898.1 acyl-CoA dehydrogenase/oxidase [Bipolaris maydis]KAJ6202941.1 acyl-CoA dehydrogenase [Bipolaris maydis]
MAQIPFSEAPYARGLPCPLYTKSHLLWQKKCKAFLDKNYHPFAAQWEEEDNVSDSYWQTFISANMFVPCMAMPLPCDWLRRVGICDVLGTPIEEFDTLHGVIYYDEIYRSGLTGPFSVVSSFTIGSPYLIRHGSHELQERFLPDILLGKKTFCLALSEPGVGSDASQISTTAVKSADGKEYIINGEKKWITSGMRSDYCILGVRTGGPGSKGLSVVVCPLKDYPGVSRRRITMSGQITALHAHITLKNVRIPVTNLVGEEGKGLKYVVSNVNHERLLLATSAARFSRVALSTAFKYSMERKAFGKALLDQAVVRHRFAKAGAQLEGFWSWVEQVAYQCSKMSEEEINKVNGGAICLLKAQGGIVFQECAEVASLIMGAVGYARNESGSLVEKLWREVIGVRVPAGSEDVMLDQGINQMRRSYQDDLGRLGESSKL